MGVDKPQIYSSVIRNDSNQVIGRKTVIFVKDARGNKRVKVFERDGLALNGKMMTLEEFKKQRERIMGATSFNEFKDVPGRSLKPYDNPNERKDRIAPTNDQPNLGNVDYRNVHTFDSTREMDRAITGYLW